MASVRLQRDDFRQALQRATLSAKDQAIVEEAIGDGARTVNVTVEVDKLPRGYLFALLGEASLNANQRAMISMRVHGIRGNQGDYERIYDTEVESAIEFASVFSALGMESPNCELMLNGRWYPVAFGTECHEDESKTIRRVWLRSTISICDIQEHLQYHLYPEVFMDRAGGRREITVRDVLHHLGLRPLQTAAADFNLRLVRSERESREVGKSVWISGPVLIKNSYDWWSRTESRSLGTPQSPRKAVVEPELETGSDEHRYYGHQHLENVGRLPFVRLFSLDTKRYVYADVDDVSDYEFDTASIERLHLPSEMLGMLSEVFNAPAEAVFGDLIAGKHGGLVVLASGSPGVGKTLTAEVYSELTERPLYVLELGELGTNAAQVEENLNRVFTRVARWNAVLQFDECEIFLAQRDDDLERSAIVGIFLRLLDYYRGILFLTTNRPQVLDHAILSRVTLHLEYPDLDADTRISIWKTMFSIAELRLTDGSFGELARLPLNGRQIRNLVRLTKILYADGNVSTADVGDVSRASVAGRAGHSDEDGSGIEGREGP